MLIYRKNATFDENLTVELQVEKTGYLPEFVKVLQCSITGDELLPSGSKVVTIQLALNIDENEYENFKFNIEKEVNTSH